MNVLLWQRIAPKGECFHVARAQMRGRYPCRRHAHDFAEVFWVEDGTGVHDINGQRQPIARGTLVAIRPEDYHGFRNTTDSGFTLVNVAFPRETVRFLHARYFPKEAGFFWARTRQPFQLSLNATRQRWLQGWTDYLARAPRTKLEIERFLIELVHELSGLSPSGEVEPTPEWLGLALEKIRDPEHFSRGTRQLARLAGRTPQHVARVLKSCHGITATDVVNRARLDHAAMQLRMSTKKIIEICLECGFQNLGHFYQLFRARFGTTPRLYRLRHHAFVRPTTR